MNKRIIQFIKYNVILDERSCDTHPVMGRIIRFPLMEYVQEHKVNVNVMGR